MMDGLHAGMYLGRESSLERRVHIVSLALMGLNHRRGLPCETVQTGHDLDQ
jgi:hypothetical protein